jgi:4-amino-4-deoxy-L-arabinose transferase-like glycosyltransferase
MERTAIATLTCSACGAPARRGEDRCAWCGSAFLPSRTSPIVEASRSGAARPMVPAKHERLPGRRIAAVALVSVALVVWWPGALPGPVAVLAGQAHLAVLLVATVGWLGAETPRQVRPWSILLAAALTATAIVIATYQSTGTALATRESRLAYLAVLAAGTWLAAVTWRRRRVPTGHHLRRRVEQPAW